MKQLLIIPILLFPLTLEAATIVYVSSTSGTEVNEWRTSTTTKTLDIDGDNVYGTYGAVQWTVGSTGQTSGGSVAPGWAYISGGSQFSIGGGAMLDSITGGADVQASITLTNFTFELTGVANTYTGMTVRVGIMADILSSAEWAADQNKGFEIIQTVGGSSTSGIISLRSGGAGDGTPEMYFFDITGVNSGDRFQISGLNNVSGLGVTQSGYLAPVTFDIIPEPSVALLGGLGLLALLRRKRM